MRVTQHTRDDTHMCLIAAIHQFEQQIVTRQLLAPAMVGIQVPGSASLRYAQILTDAPNGRLLVLDRGQRNEENRSTGEKTLSRFESYRILVGERVLSRVDELPPRARTTLLALVRDFARWRDLAKQSSPAELVRTLLDESGYTAALQAEKEARNRDLDPQLVWRGKDERDWSDLVVPAPPLFAKVPWLSNTGEAPPQ